MHPAAFFRRAVVCVALVVCLGGVVASGWLIGRAPAPVLNPLGKAHTASRSSFHTRQGRTIDTHRAYAGQGESHIQHAFESSRVPVDQGRHLFEPDVYERMQTLATSALGTDQDLPSHLAACTSVPEQVKLSVTQRDGELVVNWLTWNISNSPQVKYGLTSGAYDSLAKADTLTFVDPNSFHLVRYIHNALLTSLPSSTSLFYRVGDPDLGVWSDELTLTTPTNGSEVRTMAVFGDLGVVNAQSMQKLTDEVIAGDIGLVLHLGDYAYNMDELQGLTGDVFLNQMQNVTSRVPYMGTPGNHEHAFNFSHYSQRFSLFNYIADPAGRPDQNWWYSWDFTSGGSRTHFISLTSELYYYDYYSPSAEQVGDFQRMIEAQWKWIVADLTAAYDSGEYDWIVAYAHRPMYCSNVDDMPDCSTDAEKLRKGIPTGPGGALQWGIEDALSVRPLDLFLCAHEHSYGQNDRHARQQHALPVHQLPRGSWQKRTLPVHNGTIDFQADLNCYVDPEYPVHLVSGSAGCREFLEHYDEVFYGPWSVFRSSTYGYGRLTVHNATHLHWEQLIDEGNGGTDQLWIVKSSTEEEAEGSASSSADQIVLK